MCFYEVLHNKYGLRNTEYSVLLQCCIMSNGQWTLKMRGSSVCAFQCYQLYHKEKGIKQFRNVVECWQLMLLKVSEDLYLHHHCGKNQKSC